jgi:hypothetical protein
MLRFPLKPVSAALLALLPAACASKPAPPTEAEALSRLDPARWQVQREIPMESTANVSSAAEIKAYPVGRYVDAANPSIMHERHVIYRRERDESWRRESSQGHGILLGPTVGLPNPVARKNPSSQELAAELNRQKLITGRLLNVERQAGAGDLRARQLMIEAQTIASNQIEILRRLDQYEADRRAEQLSKAVQSAQPAAARPPDTSPPELPVPQRLETPPAKSVR